MQKIVVLCGGESGEHEVSLQSANSIIRHIDKTQYHVIPVGIDKHGRWLTGDPFLENPNDPEHICLARELKPAWLDGGYLNGEKIDVVFNVIHGTYGEDGCIQGLLSLQHIPYVGPGVLGSAIGMDKDIMKRLLDHAGIRTARAVVVYGWQEKRPSYAEVAAQLGPVLFVKPCNLGSSIGISKVKDAAAFDQALDLAFQYDRKVLVEEFIRGREIELSVLGNEEVEVSLPGEIVPGGEFYSYETKYINSNATRLEVPAKLEPNCIRDLQETALKAYRVLELEGLTRVDFFVGEQGQLWLNEVNTLPGFTNISMYPKMWQASGLAYSDLIHRLIQLALDRHRREQSLKRQR